MVALAGQFDIEGVEGTHVSRPAFARYAELCGEYPPERVAEIVWVSADQIRAIRTSHRFE